MNQDNIEAATNHEAQHLDHTITPNTGTEPGNPATTQVLIRCTPHDRDRWKQAAENRGLTLSDFIRQCLNAEAANTLDCNHPLNQRRYYPWAEFCLECGLRLRG
jgi:predicted HicB family RNase H-like nuclease